ncbi:MAG TPA: serine/threonine-protein kinase [Arachnia sp.]|nr:serine/threonine-protein kinase [Arachnia sp.]
MTGARSAPPQLDGFSYLDWIGGGGFADVFKYEQTLLGRSVAVKVLHRGLGGSALGSFRAEANTMAKLSNHPSIVSIYQAGVSADDRPFIVMEICPSKHLGARIAQRTFSIQKTLELGIQLCGAVATAHENRILHRDIKPANILFTEFGRPALTDFGISVSVEAATGQHSRALSPPWAPPEQFDASGAGMGPWSDVYSLGATLWAMLVGHSPMEVAGGPNDALSIAARARNLDPPSTGRSDVPESLDRALKVALAKSPELRYRSAVEFARALQSIQAELHQSVTSLDVLVEEASQDEVVADTGTRVGGFVLIDPDEAPGTATSTPGSDRTAGDTEMSPLVTGWGTTQPGGVQPHVLQHGQGVATPHEVDFTSPGPLQVDHGHTYVPPNDAPPVEVAKPGPRRRVVAGAVAAVVALAAGGAFAASELLPGAPTTPTETTSEVAPADPVGTIVPKVQDLVGTREGEQVTFTWVNPDPQPGDSFTYWVQVLGEDRIDELTDDTTVTVPAQEPRTCIEVELRRANGRGSAPETSCVS